MLTVNTIKITAFAQTSFYPHKIILIKKNSTFNNLGIFFFIKSNLDGLKFNLKDKIPKTAGYSEWLILFYYLEFFFQVNVFNLY